VWDLASPDAAISARLDGVDAALRRIYGDEVSSETFERAAALAEHAISSCEPGGRPLFAANLDLEWPSSPHLRLWHATTLLREHRGDGHVLALVDAELDPCEAHVLRIADSGGSVETIKPYRGWTDDDWAAATERLRSRGLLDADATLTRSGRALRTKVEDDTDRLAYEPLTRLGPRDVERFDAAMRPISQRLADDGPIPFPNPVGVTRLR
jgi:hypothetical protein